HRLRHRRAPRHAGSCGERTAGRLVLLVDEAELAARLAGLRSVRPPPARGYARLFDAHILQADEGADFDFLRGDG
ncbi:MAG TPA: hypothetical protein VM891_12270, partial [Amaricoccus sp.]|nr:hypothetical protein [Amaricoccus sp.]